MGSWGFGIYENDDASDIIFDIETFIVKYYNKSKNKLNMEELLVIADVLLSKPFDVDYFVLSDLFGRIEDGATNEYFDDWKEPTKRKRTVKNILGRLRKYFSG